MRITEPASWETHDHNIKTKLTREILDQRLHARGGLTPLVDASRKATKQLFKIVNKSLGRNEYRTGSK